MRVGDPACGAVRQRVARAYDKRVQVVAEVIIVILLVLFLRVALQAYTSPNLELGWQEIASLALLPVCIALLALALRLGELHPKPPRTRKDEQPSENK